MINSYNVILNKINIFLSNYYQVHNSILLEEIIDFCVPENLFLLDAFILYLNQKYKNDFPFLKLIILQIMVLA